jgi:hypothetical protein
MSNETVPKFRPSSQSISAIIKDVQLMLDLSPGELTDLLSILEKADFGTLHFFRGNTNIIFRKLLPTGKYSKIYLLVNVQTGDATNTANFIIPRSFIRSAKKKSLGANNAK